VRTFDLLRYVVDQKAHDLQKPTKIHNQLNSFDGQVTDHYSSILLMWSSMLYFFPQCPSSFGWPDKPPQSHNILVLSLYISNQDDAIILTQKAADLLHQLVRAC